MSHTMNPGTVPAMRRSMAGALALLALTWLTPASLHAELTLVADGEPTSVIVLPDDADAGSAEREAAELLVRHIERMSGAALPIRTAGEFEGARVEGERIVSTDDAPTTFILLGESVLTGALGVDPDALGPGGIRLKTLANALVLLGGPERVPGEPGRDDGGLRHAVIELLEHLGWQYLWPGESGWVVPEAESVVVGALDVTYTPQIRRRGIRAWQDRTRLSDRSQRGLDRIDDLTHEDWEAGRARAMDDALDATGAGWSRWQRLGGEMTTFGHAGGGLRDAQTHLEANPEWFAKQADGTRDQAGSNRWRLCHSNPDLIAHVAEDIIQRRNEDPDLELVSLDLNDGSGVVGWCQCDDCKALDPADAPSIEILIFPTTEHRARHRERVEHPSLTDRLLHYWNSVAERVTEEHPDLLFGVSAYSAHSHPPVERELHPNLVVRFVTRFEHLAGWEEAGVQRMYWRPNILNIGRRDGKLRSYLDRLVEEFHGFADAGVAGTDFDSIRHYWATLGINYFAAARLHWDPYQTRDELIAEFASSGFGEGAPYIERYFHKAEALTAAGVNHAFSSEADYRFTPEAIAELRELLNSAEAAADDSLVSERIAFLRLGLNFTELQERLSWKSWRADQGQDYDEDLAQRLIDLNALVLREIIVNHTWAINVPHMLWRSATLSMYSPIGGRTATPSDDALLERIADPDYGLTGREEGLKAMLEAFGL